MGLGPWGAGEGEREASGGGEDAVNMRLPW